jgi:hypothetical protein
MQTNIEKQILQETEGLPESALDEVLHFIQFIKSKWHKKIDNTSYDNISNDLSKLGTEEWHHLEDEIKDYKKLFPHVK